MDIVSYSYRKPVTSGYRHTRVVGQTSYTTSDRPSQRVYVPARTYYDDWDATPSRSTVTVRRRSASVTPETSSYTSISSSRRSSLSSSMSSSFSSSRLSSSSSGVYLSSGRRFSVSDPYEVTKLNRYERPSTRFSSYTSPYLGGSSSLFSSTTPNYSSKYSARLRQPLDLNRELNLLWAKPDHYVERNRASRFNLNQRIAVLSLGHYSGLRDYVTRKVGSSDRYPYGTAPSRLFESLDLAYQTPSTSVVHYKSYSSRGSSGLSSSSASSSLSRSSVGDYSYSGGSTGSWRRKYMDLDGQDDLDGPVTRRSRDSDEVYFDKMHKILSASPNVGVPPEPSCISGGVYLGTSADAENVAMMKAMRIQYILNCAGGVGVYSYKRVKDLYGPDAGIQGYEELYADDSETYDIRSCFDRAHAFLDHARSKNARVLIHCPGVSRSGAVAISWLLREGTPLLAATKMVKDKRRNALANTAFIRQLVSYARSRNQLDYDPTSVRAPTYHRVLHKARIMSAHLPLFV